MPANTRAFLSLQKAMKVLVDTSFWSWPCAATG
jgi:hypothetical protein